MLAFTWFPPAPQALAREADSLLEELSHGLASQPPRLQRKHAGLAQFAAMMAAAAQAAHGGGPEAGSS